KCDEGKVLDVFTVHMQIPKFNKASFKRDMLIPDGTTMLINLGSYSEEVRDGETSWFTELVFGQEVTVKVDRQILLLVTPRITTGEIQKVCPTARSMAVVGP